MWGALQRRSKSPAAYAATQRLILSQFYRWLEKQQLLLAPLPVNFEARAYLALVHIMTAAIRSMSNSEPAIEQHKLLRGAAVSGRTKLKGINFLYTRELDRLDVLDQVDRITNRENSRLYQR